MITYIIFFKKLSNNESDSRVLNLEGMDREETIKTFDEFMKKSDKTIY